VPPALFGQRDLAYACPRENLNTLVTVAVTVAVTVTVTVSVNGSQSKIEGVTLPSPCVMNETVQE
jgi:hypothetical protein